MTPRPARFPRTRRGRRWHPAIAAAVGLALALGAAGCSSSGGSDAAPRGDCPVAPVRIVVSVDQWGDIVDRLAGDCGDVTTVIEGSSGDPHDFEPAPSDIAAFDDAKLVVVNGLGYDTWATRAVDALDDRPAVVDAGDVVGLRDGANPHVWYGPGYVDAVGGAVTAELRRLAPQAADYFEARAARWHDEMAPYRAAVADVRTVAEGAPYGATESVFAYMADAVGLVDRTPAGYRRAAANETDPSPGDVAAFERDLTAGRMRVLVVNTQTEGTLTDELARTARTATVPAVGVTETVPAHAHGFVDWQVGQLRRLAAALRG